MVVTAHYNNNTSEKVTDYILSGYDTTPGTKIFTVAYNGKTAEFEVEVVPKSIISIAVTTLPNKLEYLAGDPFDPMGMTVTAYYNNNTSENVTDYTVNGFDTEVGTKTVVIVYKDKTDSFEVTVNPRAPKELSSGTYKVKGNSISKITAGTTVQELLEGVGGGKFCKVYKDGVEVDADSKVGTGMTVDLIDVDTVNATYTVIVTGDTSGDGNVTVTDMIAVKAHILGKNLLSGVFADAANTNGDDGISITDFLQIKAKILGKSEITAR
jgi:hypothetical protein